MTAQPAQILSTDKTQGLIRWLALAHFSNDFFSGSLPVVLVAQNEQLSLSDAKFAAIPSIFLSISILQPLIGWLADKMRHSYLLLGGSFLNALGVLLVALAPSYEFMIFGAILGGLGHAMFHPFALASVRGLASRKEGSQSIGIFMFGGDGAFAIGPVISAFFLQHFGLPSMTILVIISAMVVPMIILRVRPALLANNISAKPKVKKRKTERSNMQGALLTARQIAILVILSYLIIVMIRTTANQSFSTFLPKFYKEQDRSLVYAGFATTVLLLFAAVGSYLGGTLSKYISRRLIIGASLVALTPLTLLLLRADGIWIFILSIFVGMLVNANWPLLLMTGQEVLPGGAIGASGLTFGWGFLSAALGSFLIGNLSDAIGLTDALSVLALLPLPAALLVFFLPPQEQEEDDEETEVEMVVETTESL